MENVFNAIITRVNFRIKSLGESFDGLAYWHKMKEILSKLQRPFGIPGGLSDGEDAYKWSIRDSEDSDDYEHILQLPEFNEDGSTNVANHSIIQLVRIPRKYPCTITKVFQIAFDIGQFAALNEHHYARLVQYGLDSMSDYIDPDVEILMDQTINCNPMVIDELLSM
jgi:hypothetical protein